jgi:hypothetical protein
MVWHIGARPLSNVHPSSFFAKAYSTTLTWRARETTTSLSFGFLLLKPVRSFFGSADQSYPLFYAVVVVFFGSFAVPPPPRRHFSRHARAHRGR